MKQLLILSGKGGTGKTTVASAFIKLATVKAYADCDVDAPNLHLTMGELPEPLTRAYYGLDKAVIDTELCTGCDLCRVHCRFDAINVNDYYEVDFFACEGCAVCAEICPVEAIAMVPAVAGELMLYKGDSVFSTARLKMGSGNSGLLVTDVKKQLTEAAPNVEYAIIDGSPGIGCPVIASLSGVDLVLIVAEPSLSGISDMERIIKTARGFLVDVAICINKFDTNLANTARIEEYAREKDLTLVGKIPYDQKAVTAINEGKTIVEVDSLAGEAVKGVFDRTMELLLG
ncbi:MAG: ATP-binding protein [Bacillota bacterium]